jgi:hypothetical protein
VRLRQFFTGLIGLAILGFLGWLLFSVFRSAWHSLVGVNPQLAGALVTGAATILVGTATVMLGRYFEREREIEAQFRTKKIEIYDQFLCELFKVFHAGSQELVNDQLVGFMRDWQRKLVLWAGPEVLRTYFLFMSRLKAGDPDAQAVLLMDDFFRALRSDIGQSSAGLKRGAFSHLIFRHPEFFLEQASQNPSLTLKALAELEKKRFGPDES